VTRLDGCPRNIRHGGGWVWEYYTTRICKDVLELGLFVRRLIQECVTLTARFSKIFLEFALLLWFLLFLFFSPVVIFIFVQAFLAVFLAISAFCFTGILGHNCRLSLGIVS
jgi:hypothetical protein